MQYKVSRHLWCQQTKALYELAPVVLLPSDNGAILSVWLGQYHDLGEWLEETTLAGTLNTIKKYLK